MLEGIAYWGSLVGLIVGVAWYLLGFLGAYFFKHSDTPSDKLTVALAEEKYGSVYVRAALNQTPLLVFVISLILFCNVPST